MRVGLAGLGKMGAAMSARLLELGHSLTVWNRTPGKALALVQAGAKVAENPAKLAAACDVTITILADASAIDAVYNGSNGLLSGDVKGKMFVEMSTELPSVKVSLAEKVKAKSASLIDCPVGGSVNPARQGKLLGLMGCSEKDAARVRPLLEQLCQRVEHCGDVGAGAEMKLAVNLPLMIGWQAYGEAFAICRDLGFEPKRLVDLLSNTSGANNGIKTRAPMIATMLEGGDPGPTTFSISNAVKDIKVMLAVAKEKGIELPALQMALAGFEEANAHGLGGADGAALSVYWSKRKK
ncbi:MAG: 3-hydroxyisobutyrate dehydrogenase family protein [Pseudolabrys sp.]|jgi:3-hydroxyisobutyrate dehydrogenase|nr:3-hydroxyisobutyrate dehydrogenase family protein [Pseudolabrys sp.]